MNIGTRLSEARRRCGKTLDGVAAATKMSRQTLDRIEHNDFDRLPGGILTKGYLRAYAAEVGLNPSNVVDEYMAQCFGEAGEQLRIVPPPPVEAETHPARAFALELVLIAIAAGTYLSYRAAPQSPAPAARPLEAVGILPPVAPPPSLQTAVLPAVLTGRAAEPGVHLEFEPSGPCWISATADGRLIVHRLFERGQRAVVTARDAVVLRVGDPDTFVYWLNGAPGRRLGPGGEPQTVQISGDNYQTFLMDAAAGAQRALREAT